ncbi:hypothetical protein [Novosphingobium soli]|uniref:VOC domain-containing protein n=1 Tax=Novosphingobium soli TaxID=574956 RepID=A0ABV6D0F4_9SPHN
MTHLGPRYGALVQMSYVTRDMDAAIAHAETQLGITGFVRSRPEVEVLSYGVPRRLAVEAAIANLGTPGAVRQFEIIAPVAGAIEVYEGTASRDALLAFHHVGIAVPGPYAAWEALLADVRASGDPLALLFPAAPSPGTKLCFCYVDTRARLGHVTEYLWADPSLAGIAAAPWLGPPRS